MKLQPKPQGNHLYLEPTYGRTYADDQAVLRDWNDGKDFRILSGPYCSVRDSRALLEDMGVVEIRIVRSYQDWLRLLSYPTALVENKKFYVVVRLDVVAVL